MSSVLKLRKTSKNGTATYEIEGVRGSLYITKQMFGAAGAPAELSFGGDIFAAPGSGGSRGSREADPERIAKAKERADKAVARAEKAKARADKLTANAAKLVAKGPVAPVAEQEPVGAVD